MNPIEKHKRPGRPLILAHRGVVTRHQENTMPAIRAALDSEACDGCEFDVFLTRDEKVVLFHDEDLERLTGVKKNIDDMTWAELKTLTVRKDIEVDGGLRNYPKEEAIPLLSDVLEEIKGKPFFADIEIKAYRPRWSKRHTGREVAKIVREIGVEDQVICSSFDFFMLHALEKEHRHLNSGFAYDDAIPLSQKLLNWVMERNLVGRFIHSNLAVIEHSLIDQDTIEKFHRKGMSVGTYTIFPLTPDDNKDEKYAHFAAELRRLTDLGVDWIETDNPEWVYEILMENKSETRNPKS